MRLDPAWLEMGFFKFDSARSRSTPTDEIRRFLARGLHLEPREIRRKGYPVGPAYRHTVWWREGKHDYAETQFFAQIEHAQPVMTLGLSVEKGYEPPTTPERDSELMDRRTWDWPGLLRSGSEVLGKGVADVSGRLDRSVHVHLAGYAMNPEDRERAYFSFVRGRWYRRHEGTAKTAKVLEKIASFDTRHDWWLDLYIGCAFSPAEVADMDTQAAAEVLLAFAPLRKMIRG
jgi:hypothetical protein